MNFSFQLRSEILENVFIKVLPRNLVLYNINEKKSENFANDCRIKIIALMQGFFQVISFETCKKSYKL